MTPTEKALVWQYKRDYKPILDACCGGRMFWFDKENPLVTFMDNREYSGELCDGRYFEVNPDIVADFTDIPFPDKSRKLVVYDPPHLTRAKENGWQAIKYGTLKGQDWQKVIKAGFDECMRVLDDYGVLIFKWCEENIPVSHIIAAVKQPPLFGHKSGKTGKTHWLCFMKMPAATTKQV